MLWKLMAGAVLCLLVLAGSAQALTVQPVGSGFVEPIYVTSDPGNPDQLFVVERGGSIALVQDGEVRPFADIHQLVSTGGEGGLLSIALAPDFDSSGRLFLYYTGKDETPGEIHVAEMTANGNFAATGTLRDVIAPIPHPEDSNHYGGQLQFGPDGALYVATGDGGGQNDEHENAQNPSKLLGKLLRVVPSQSGLVAPGVWALGLRNPFRFSFDRLTGDLWIGDVGQGVKEEVDFAAAPTPAGLNYGWNCFEGSEPGPTPADPECAGKTFADFVAPVFEYENPPADCAAVIGGYLARGPQMGDVYGRYVYGDLCAGDIRSFSPAAPSLTDRFEGLHVDNLNSFGEDSCGRLYAVSGNGPVYRLVGTQAATCGNPQPGAAALAPSYVGVRALRRKVKRNRRALISAWVSPCNGRRGDPVTLWRGRRKLGTRHLDKVCSARFRPRISRRSSFRVTVNADDAYVAAISRRLTLKPLRRHRR
ncbi:MAG TPA: PQQ-dependent sugar dehydrogenase [Solirubrobacterales bacterium]|nr:PQQ-dependent sugar dehydrogenase [Solirubrobacterales bacterium]